VTVSEPIPAAGPRRNRPGAREARNLDLVGYHDLGGDPGFKLAMQEAAGRRYLYLCHLWRSAWSILDVTDPIAPALVRTIDGPEHSWTLQVQVADGLMLTALERPTPGWGFDPGLTEQVGVLVWDVATDPTEPRLLAHYDTGGRGTHRNFYAGGRYAYLAAQPEGFHGNILVVLDLDDPRRPTETGRWWWPGQHIAGGEQPQFPHYLHGAPYKSGDLAYLSYGRVGMVVLDVSTPSAPAMVSRVSFGDFASALGCHSAVPYDRNLVVANSESIEEGDAEPLNYAVVIDVGDPARPRIISWLPIPLPEPGSDAGPDGGPDVRLEGGAAGAPASRYDRGGRFGPHNQHQSQGQPCLAENGSLVYLTYFNAGLRVYDISQPLHPHEVACYVPEDPVERRGPKPTGALVTQFEDVLVDDRGYIFCTDKNHGLFVLKGR
jgi:hypothetical protein